VSKPLILLTNDDGVHSPGLAAAADRLDKLGDLLIVAPEVQQTSMSRSRSQNQGVDGTISETTVRFGSRSWPAYSVKATPALAVVHAVKEIADRPISLVVSGINFGENIGSCVTVSGTIGAAIEAAEKGIPALAVSQEIDSIDYHSYSSEVEFEVAAKFTYHVAEVMLKAALPFDADVIKLEVPLGANSSTEIVITRQDRLIYYKPTPIEREKLLNTPAKISHLPSKGEFTRKDTDAYAQSKGLVSITPLSFDLTSRNCLEPLSDIFGADILNEEGS
jgi:5'-nucleotidase